MRATKSGAFQSPRGFVSALVGRNKRSALRRLAAGRVGVWRAHAELPLVIVSLPYGGRPFPEDWVCEFDGLAELARHEWRNALRLLRPTRLHYRVAVR